MTFCFTCNISKFSSKNKAFSTSVSESYFKNDYEKFRALSYKRTFASIKNRSFLDSNIQMGMEANEEDKSKYNRNLISVDKEAVKLITMEWVREFVIGLNLCPFAEAVVREDSHRILVDTDATLKSDVWSIVQFEIEKLIRTPAEEISTTLVVVPQFAVNDFLKFHEVCTWMEMELEDDERMKDSVMLACFHPQHEWAYALSTRDSINFDKRSPFAIINILRTAQIDQYIEQGRTQGILQRNRHSLEHVGENEINRRFDALYNSP